MKKIGRIGEDIVRHGWDKVKERHKEKIAQIKAIDDITDDSQRNIDLSGKVH